MSSAEKSNCIWGEKCLKVMKRECWEDGSGSGYSYPTRVNKDVHRTEFKVPDGTAYTCDVCVFGRTKDPCYFCKVLMFDAWIPHVWEFETVCRVCEERAFPPGFCSTFQGHKDELYKQLWRGLIK